MAQLELTTEMDGRNSVLCAPDTELKEILVEGFRLIDHEPAICKCIDTDIDLACKQAKKDRVLDRLWEEQHSPALPGLAPTTVDEFRSVHAAELQLEAGRQRLLDGEAVFLFMLARGYLGSVTSRSALDRLLDSKLFRDYLAARNMRMPSRTCILGYLNAIRPATREKIFFADLDMLLADDLSDRALLAIDSFAVSGNTSWPTDSNLMYRLLARAYRLGRFWEELNLPAFTQAYVPDWLDQMKTLDFKINCTAGKPNSKKKIKKMYKQALELCQKVARRLIKQFKKHYKVWLAVPARPSRRRQLDKLVNQIEDSLEAALRICQYTGDRVCHGVTLPAAEKVLSLCDECAAFIKKGGREPVIGYKPQVGRDGAGFITAIELQQGNPSDQTRLVPMVEQHLANTGNLPDMVTVDDGYSSKKGVTRVKEMGVDIVSVNGSKGKKLTPEEDWESQAYKDARAARSAVESLVFTMRYKFHLYRFSRRGIEAVRAELFEKAIVHNLWRAAQIRKKRSEPDKLDPAA